MGPGHKGQVVGADFVGHISVGGYTIATDQHCIHFTAPHQQTTGSINNRNARNTKTTQLPGR